MRVKAIATGCYGQFLRHPGAVFDIRAEEFSAKWMQEVSDDEALCLEGNKSLNNLPVYP